MAMALKRRPVPPGNTPQPTSSDFYALPLRTISEEYSDAPDTSFTSRSIDKSPNETVSLPLTRYPETKSQGRSRYQPLPVGESDDPAVGKVDGLPAVVHNAPAQQHVRKSQYAALSTRDIGEGEEPTDPSGPAPPFGPSSKTLKGPSWRPLGLKRSALLATLIVSLILGLVVIFLLVYSTLHKGLGRDGGSSAILFGWRFTPTLVAVLYSVLPWMVFNDARRTEAFAQMSYAAGAPAATSILKRPEHWWKVLAVSFKKNQNHGHVNYFLLLAVLVNMISFLLISPLSSALLQSQPVDLVSEVPISNYALSESQPVSMAANDLVYFRTTSNVLQNLSTSAWLTDKYVVIPFWPSSTESNLGTTLMDTTQQWQADAQVLSVELECESMNIHKAYWTKNFTSKDDGKEREVGFHALLLTDTRGCEFGFNGYSQYLRYGGGSWFAPPNLVLPIWDPSNDEDEEEWYHYYNSTTQCDGRQIIFASSTNGSWQGQLVTSWNSEYKAEAWSCQSTFYTANMSVNASTTTTGTNILVDDATFHARRDLIPKAVLDQERFETAFLHRNWTNMIYTPDINGQNAYGGPSALLGALYNFDSASLMSSRAVMENVQKIKQRFLGEMVMATVAENSPVSQTGQITDTQRRVVVNLPVAIPLAALFIITSLMIGGVLLLSSRRQLNLHNDTASIAAVVKLVDGNPTIQDNFRTWNQRKDLDLDDALMGTTHFLSDGTIASVKDIVETKGSHVALHLHSGELIKPADHPKPRIRNHEDWRPFTVGRLGGLLLLVLFSSIFAVILVLFILSHTTGLYQSAFTYETQFSSSEILTFAPYSIVPTLLAVGVVLWWENIDDTFRRLQPYVSMAQKAVPISPVIGLSYLNTLSIGSVVRALANKHWLVALVSFGAVLGQVLTVSMSALWQRTDGSRPGDMILTRTLEPRSQPFVYKYSVGTSMGGGSQVGKTTLAEFYGHLSTNWLYSATLQLAYNGSEPPWSKDGWSFVPVELSSIQESEMYRATPSTKDSTSSAVTKPPSVNVTITTPALRGILDCTPLEAAANLSSWLTEWDLTDSAKWNISVNPVGLDRGFEVNGLIELGPQAALSTTPILAQEHTIVCCANTSGDTSSESAIGYWSANYAQHQVYDFDTYSGPYPRNLTLKWISGNAARQNYMGNETYQGNHGEYRDFRHLIWSKTPVMSAINCRPRIEWTNATVTVDMETNQIWDYKILGTPEPVDWPWSDVYLSHNYSEPGDDPAGGSFHQQITVSYGVLFQDAMLFASNLKVLWPSGGTATKVEDLDDKNFNFRRPEQGLNTDLMSYSMYQLAGGDLDRLMDPVQMTELGQRVFTTFFQHFVSSNRSASGGWAFQEVGATLPPDLGPVLNASTDSGLAEYQTQNSTLTSDTTAPVHVDISVEILKMAPVAVYLSLAILLILAVITIVISLLAYPHFKLLQHNFEDLGSIISVVHASEKLQSWVQAHPDPAQWSTKVDNGQTPYVRLGPFVGRGGTETWGIEIVEDVDEGKFKPPDVRN
jgi:hypothetical protein